MAKKQLYIVDDDAAVRDALSVVFELEEYAVRGFESGDRFLEELDTLPPAAILLDIRMPGRDGLEILNELHARHYRAPVLMISGHGDVPMAVKAMKLGATDFIEKPFDGSTVVRKVAAAQQAAAEKTGLARGCEKLTSRECEIMQLIAAGGSSKEIGRQLGVSPRTVETHRARIMSKLGARNAADLVRIALQETGL